jgi:hypothetical protein
MKWFSFQKEQVDPLLKGILGFNHKKEFLVNLLVLSMS